MGDVRYPNIHVRLTGSDGNAFAVLGTVWTAMQYAGLPMDAVNEFTDEATSGDYNHLLATAMRYVKVT